MGEIYGGIGSVGNVGMMIVAQGLATLSGFLLELPDAEAQRTQRRGVKRIDERRLNQISGEIVDAAVGVHSALGPGLLESAYEACLAYELRERGLSVRTQIQLPVVYKGIRLERAYRIDMLVEEAVVVENKTLSAIHPIHEAQLLTHLKLSGHRLGLILNYYVPFMRDGIKRIVNGL